jgi:para-aminobenzoate synthetase component 1
VNEENGIVRCWGGGGIVADSKAELEYEESLQKIRNLLDGLS